MPQQPASSPPSGSVRTLHSLTPAAVDGEGSWRAHAACRDADPAWFFDADEDLQERARALCAACSVRSACLDYALTAREAYGIWGGMDERERQRVLRRRRRAA